MKIANHLSKKMLNTEAENEDTILEGRTMEAHHILKHLQVTLPGSPNCDKRHHSHWGYTQDTAGVSTFTT